MIYNPNVYRTMSLGIVLRRTPGVTRWARWSWQCVAVLPGAGPADWRELRREGDIVEYHAATLALELHGAETPAYMAALAGVVPAIWVIMRKAPSDADCPLDIVLVTASPYEAEDYLDSGEEIVEKVPMPAGLIAWVRDFCAEHHKEEVFVKRQRDKKRVDLVQDGVGDSRVAKPADIYASPALKRSRMQ